MAKTPRSAAKSAPAPQAAQSVPASDEAAAQNGIPGEGASGTAREAPSAGSGPEAAAKATTEGGVQPAPPHSETTDQSPAQNGIPGEGASGAAREAPAADSSPEAVVTVTAEDGVQPAPPQSGVTGQSPSVERANARLSREELRVAQCAGLVGAISSFDAAEDDFAGHARFLDVEIEVIGWRLYEDALMLVSSAGRKYRADRITGEVTDTATGEVLL